MAGILVVDDSKLARTYLVNLLNERGFEVEEQEPTSLVDILGALRVFRPEVLITDYEMPNCKGESLVRAIREDPVLKRTKVMILSSHREEVMVKRLAELGVDSFLIKGPGYRDVIDRLKELM